ncbi:MAG: ArsR family transcriptional regulator [Methanobacteriota archaeon]
MTEDEILELKIRRQIYQHIVKYPGLHKRELVRHTTIAYSTLDYHLHNLLRRNLIIAEEDQGFTRYYATGKIGIKDKKIINILRQSVPREIILYLLLHPSATHESLRNHLHLAPSTTSYHLKKLTTLQIISSTPVKKESAYTVNDPEYIIDLLVTFKQIFLSNAVDQFVRTIVDIHPKYLRKQEKKDEGEG